MTVAELEEYRGGVYGGSIQYDDYDAQKLPRPYRFTSIVRYRFVESDHVEDQWTIQIKSMFFGWHTLAVRSGIDRAIRYVALDRAAREPSR